MEKRRGGCLLKPRALILHATGTNRDLDLKAALELAGAQAEIVHINQLRRHERRWEDYHLVGLPGGFSYADALGAGRLFALDLKAYFADQVGEFVSAGKPVIGICNGFQALVKAGILPAASSEQVYGSSVRATLTFNACGHFECRWVTIAPVSQRCIWTRGLTAAIYCPVAHGEGNFIFEPPETFSALHQDGQVALVYVRRDGKPLRGAYPDNPNGSMEDIAGICNPEGNVLGLMPHPENHIYPYQHPNRTRGDFTGSGLSLFLNGVNYARSS
jgi:phosphoribosylformylglycinamidine synthase